MSFTDVMYGPLGQVNNQFQANLGQNAAMNQGNQFAAQQQQAAMAAQQAQLASLYGGGGFGGQTAYYAGLGADYGRATGGFGGYGGMNDPFSPVGGYNPMDAMAGISGSGYNTLDAQAGGGGFDPTQPWGGPNNPMYWQMQGLGANAMQPGTSGSNPMAGALWQGTNSGYNAPAMPGIDYSGNAATGAWDMTQPWGGPNNPMYWQMMGMTSPAGGGGSPLMASNPSWLGAGGSQNDYNPFGAINSGMVGPQSNAFSFDPTLPWGGMASPYGMGGIGSDATHDPYGWMLAQSSPYATPYNPPSSSYPNIGYNPSMQNYFANPGMQTNNVDISQGAINNATGQMQGLLDWYNQLMFDPNFRGQGSMPPPLPGGGASTPGVLGQAGY